MPLNIDVTQFPNGIGSVGDNNILNGVGLPLPMLGSVRVEDFASDSNFDSVWAAQLFSGVTNRTLILSPSGVLQFDTDGTPGTGASLEASAAGVGNDVFQVSAGVPCFFAARMNFSDAVVNGWQLGFVPGLSAFAPADGLYLKSFAATGDVFLTIENSGTDADDQLVGTLTGGVSGFLDIAFYWDGIKASAQFPGGGGSFIPDPANIPAVGLNPTITVLEGAGGIATFDVDWVAFGGGR